ncbi:putative ribonuclease H protein At1g65750 family [Senna tora]|uniref:Putative ribonuclease H protein At1g65750 family n=1 Tax=Senna tora TaxID=362788 RepID=A0A834W610_9FABA|nr:putative ribonuclease H protein At1g65750 family [Senna tora]
MVDANSLVDLGFSGPGFTWERGGVAARLDRALANMGWRNMFPEASVLHLPPLKSDHSPILIRTHGMVDSGAHKDRPFRFLASWLLHDDFPNVVKDSWQLDWHWSLSTFQEKIKGWNRDVFGNIFRKKERLLRRLQGIHNRLSMGPNLFLSNLQDELWVEYENVLTQEEILWMQKSREQWIVNGDRNTRFFHVSTMTKQDGGLGLRHVRDQNKAFMTKLGWGLINQKDALWARVLRAKYKCGDDLIPKVRRMNTASRLWKGIADSWNHVQEGMVWRIGDGKRVRFWSDPWLPNGRVLCHYSFVPLSDVDLEKVAADFVSASGGWEWGKFEFLLPTEICSLIAAVTPPSCIVQGDHIAWKHSRDGTFSTRSAYHAITNENGVGRHNFWKLLWKWKGMEKVRSFLWLCGHDRILTNVARKRRGMAATDVCTRCNVAAEDLLHTLRDCVKARSIWLKLVHPSKWHLFFNTSRLNWLSLNLSSNMGWHGSDWGVIFAYACWYIWRMRNAEVFDNSRIGNADPVLAILKLSTDSSRAFDRISSGNFGHSAQVQRFICWEKPSSGWVKFNVDAARRESLNLSACGGIARDSVGRFIIGFMRSLGDASVLNAELWGIFCALEVAWSAGFKKVLVESDSLLAVNLVNDSIPLSHPCSPILSRIHHWISCDWEVQVVHIHREGNCVADTMAGHAFGGPLDLNIFHEAPAFLFPVLRADLEGKGSYHLCMG